MTRDDACPEVGPCSISAVKFVGFGVVLGDFPGLLDTDDAFYMTTLSTPILFYKSEESVVYVSM